MGLLNGFFYKSIWNACRTRLSLKRGFDGCGTDSADATDLTDSADSMDSADLTDLTDL